MDDVLLPSDEELLKEQTLLEQMDEPEDDYSLLDKSPSPEIIDSDECEQRKSDNVIEDDTAKEVVDDMSDKPCNMVESCEFPSTISDLKSDIVMISSSDIPDVYSMGSVTTEPTKLGKDLLVKEDEFYSIESPISIHESVGEETEKIPQHEEEPSLLEIQPDTKYAPGNEGTVEEVIPAKEVDGVVFSGEDISEIKGPKQVEKDAVSIEEHAITDDTVATEVVAMNDEATPTPEEVPISEDPIEDATPTPPINYGGTQALSMSSVQGIPIDLGAIVEKDVLLEGNAEEIEPLVSPCEILSEKTATAVVEKPIEILVEPTLELVSETGKSNDADDNAPLKDNILEIEPPISLFEVLSVSEKPEIALEPKKSNDADENAPSEDNIEESKDPISLFEVLSVSEKPATAVHENTFDILAEPTPQLDLEPVKSNDAGENKPSEDNIEQIKNPISPCEVVSVSEKPTTALVEKTVETLAELNMELALETGKSNDAGENAPLEENIEKTKPSISPCEVVSISEKLSTALVEKTVETLELASKPEKSNDADKGVPSEDNIEKTESPISPCEDVSASEKPSTALVEKTVEIIAEPTRELALELGKSNDDADDNLPDDIVVVEREADKDMKDGDNDAVEQEDWLDVLGNGQLKKKTKVEGRGDRMEKGDQVTIIYSLTLASGKTIDTNVEQTFQLGDGEVIQAIDLTANLSKVGEKYEVVSFSRFAYDVLGRPPVIGSNCSVMLEVEIIRSEKTLKIEDMSEEERINIGDRKRKIGNDYFSRNDFANASRSYDGAIYYLDPPSYKVSNEPSETLKDLQFKSWCNLAIADLKQSKLDPGIRAANRALEIQPDSTKAMYRKAKLLVEKGSLTEAEVVLKKACELDPKSPGCKAFLKELTKKIASQKKKEKMMYQKMFSLGDKEDDGAKSLSNDDNTWTSGLFPMIATTVAVGSLAVAAYKMLQ